MCNDVIMHEDEAREKLQGWFAGAVPDGWFEGPPEVSLDNDEILVMGGLLGPDVGKSATAEARRTAEASRIERFREETRERRMRSAGEAEHRFRRKVSWGARCGETTELFTTASVPVMTRLRMKERRVLDTLIAAGVARSRSDALAWCVRLVGDNEEEWIKELQAAFEHVQQARAKGPRSAKSQGGAKGA